MRVRLIYVPVVQCERKVVTQCHVPVLWQSRVRVELLILTSLARELQDGRAVSVVPVDVEQLSHILWREYEQLCLPIVLLFFICQWDDRWRALAVQVLFEGDRDIVSPCSR